MLLFLESGPKKNFRLNGFTKTVTLHRFFRVDESFRTSTRAGLTRARSLNTWVYSERNAVTPLPVYSPSYGVPCNTKVTFEKIKR